MNAREPVTGNAPLSHGRGPIPRSRSRSRLSFLAAIAMLALPLLPVGAGSANGEETAILVELNRLETVETACRLSFVLTNGLDVSIETLSVEAVLFDTDDRVDRFLLLKTRPLPSGRTRVQQFDVASPSCGRIARILLNDVTACSGDGLTPSACLAALRPASRADVPFTTVLAPMGD